mmetsp:Transcript_55319/g.134359  ORF Transcript_55319/g.134359 Transcript_55319/m.134359 type:complete len:206 (-) Transcript_55319:76-693(-)
MSRLFALIAGANAVIAVTPQIDVPAVKRSVISLGSPAIRPAMGISVNPAPTDATTTGNPAEPVVINSTKDNFAATATIPACRIDLVEYCTPGWNVSNTPTVFLRVIPNKIETGIPLNGTPAADDTTSAKENPAAAVAAEMAIPGSNDDDDEDDAEDGVVFAVVVGGGGGVSLVESSLLLSLLLSFSRDGAVEKNDDDCRPLKLKE